MSNHPVAVAVEPLRSSAENSAAEYARKVVDEVAKELEAAGGDAKVVAPHPHGRMGRFEYYQAREKVSLVSSLTATDESKPHSYMPNAPHYVVMDPQRIERFVELVRRESVMQFDAFVAKLVQKIGACDSAELDSSNVWAYSILTVCKADAVEQWKTQQIVNVSRLGKVFNQWPTRKLGGALAKGEA